MTAPRKSPKRDALVRVAHFPNTQDTDFEINIFRENDPELNPYPLMKEWLRFSRSIVREVTELWIIHIVVNESIARRLDVSTMAMW